MERIPVIIAMQVGLVPFSLFMGAFAAARAVKDNVEDFYTEPTSLWGIRVTTNKQRGMLTPLLVVDSLAVAAFIMLAVPLVAPAVVSQELHKQ